MKNSSEKLSLGTKLGFGVGDIFGGGAMVVIGFFYLYFLTDVVLISPALAGIIFLISKGWDAISDPLMGLITDRTRTRFGRRRPYFLAGVIFIFLAFFMMWYPINFENEMHRFLYVLVAYVFYSTVYTMVMIPYFAMASEITLDYDERTSVTTFRIVFSSTSSLLCAVIPLEIVKYFNDERTGFLAMAIIFGVFFGLPYLATFFATTERKEFQMEQKKFNFRETFIEPLKLPTFMNFLFMYLFAMTTMDIIMSVMMYFMTYYIGRPEETSYVLGVMLVVQILALPVFQQISNRKGKRNTYMYAALWWVVIMGMSFWMTPALPGWVVYVFGAMIGIGSGGLVIMVYSILPDVPDVDELYSGLRREGTYSGLITFLRKLSSALGIYIVSNVIQFSGFKKPVENTVDGVVQLVKQQQSPEFIFTLKILLAVLPVVFLAIGIYNAWHYRLTPETHERLKNFLNNRRSGGKYDPEEEKELKRILEQKDPMPVQ
ncbi:MAG: MFS transporter [Spirochaetota bacterium]